MHHILFSPTASARPAKQPTFTKGLTNAAVEECGELTLQCQVQGHPEPRVTFSRGTQQLQPSSRLAIESDQYGTWTLRLSDCALVDAGEVTATANNTLASATCRCQVKVFPEGTPLPCQDASRSSRQQKSQNNQQLKGRSGSKLTQKTSHPGPHLSDNTARTPSTAALITPSHLQLEDSLTTSSDAKRGGREQEDIQQVPTKPGTASGKPEDLSGALEELHDTTLEETQRSPLLLLSNTASASEASVHEELDAIAGDVGGGGSGVGAAAVSVRHSGQGSNKHLHNFSAIAEETSDLAACVGESFPSAPVHGASLDLDYYPSSHDDHTSSSSDTDNNEDGKELTLMRPTDYLHSTSSTHQTSQTNPPALPSSLPPNQLHASSSLEDPCLQKHEGCLRDSPSSASPSGAPQSVTGTIAEREHRKWEAAVPLPNNPYSPERLAHRLSHSRPPDHAIYTRSSSVDFSGGSEVDLDPSLQDGLPCRADLNRYSRDYYVAGSTNGTAAARSRSNFVNHQKHGQENYQTPKPQPLTNGCHTPPNTSQQVTRNGQVCHTLPQMHVAAPCMSVDGIQVLKVPFSYQSPTHDCDPTLHHPSPVLSPPSNCSAFHVSDNTSRTVSRSKGRKTLSAEPGKLHISIIDRLDKSRVSLPSSQVTLGPNRGLKQEGILSTATPVTQPDSHNSLYEKTRQSVSISSSSTTSSPVSSLVTPLFPESPGIRELEGNFIHHNLARLSFRSWKTTREFSLNPLFEDEDRVQGGDSVETHSNRAVLQSVEPLSDYYSSYESLPYLSSFSREGSLKLPKPQVTEEVFESLSDIGGSLRLSKRKSSLKAWGSFKHKRNMMF
ncbi:Muscle M-line assembly protein unc-89 [Portunus trituberculatus]|uniref:Muscle M-line assembly protein unc-89 n=1 Tax=Portunus trituberculatus TaxID=210409 RepID=A0A5B7EYQ3_PORTR|nr:Muscle M-line assembly protein unc-89 [Portunus trituberculatus]